MGSNGTENPADPKLRTLFAAFHNAYAMRSQQADGSPKLVLVQSTNSYSGHPPADRGKLPSGRIQDDLVRQDVVETNGNPEILAKQMGRKVLNIGADEIPLDAETV